MFYGHPYCTDSDILLYIFLFLLTNVLISRFGSKRLLNALKVNVNEKCGKQKQGGGNDKRRGLKEAEEGVCPSGRNPGNEP